MTSPDLFTAYQEREKALSLHEKKDEGRLYIAKAKAVAFHLAAKNGSVTVDEVRAIVGDPPEQSDPRIMGAIFKSGWRKCGYETSTRGVNNGRPIARFEPVGAA